MSKHIIGILIAVAGIVTPVLAAPPVIHAIQPITPTSVGLYEKFELIVDLEATYSNPFDPDQVDLWAEFTVPVRQGDRRSGASTIRRSGRVPGWSALPRRRKGPGSTW